MTLIPSELRECSRGFRGWSLIVLLPTAVLLADFLHEPRWLFMWLLALAIFSGLKWLTWRRTRVQSAPWWRHAGYLFLWPGFDAETFLVATPQGRSPSPHSTELISSIVCFLAGLFLFFVAPGLFPNLDAYWIGWMGMVGVVLVLHFGSFHALSCLWRSLGVEAFPLMVRPVRSSSLSEFWGERWNTAFRDLTHRYLFIPLSSRLGPRWGIFFGFLMSGLIHDIVISIPAKGGYGLPTLYFILQAVGFFIERSRWGKRAGLRRHVWGWLFTMAFLAIPVPLLFHGPFIQNVVLPFMEAMGAR